MLSSVPSALPDFNHSVCISCVPAVFLPKWFYSFPKKVPQKILCFEPVKNFWQTFQCSVLVACALEEMAAPGSVLLQRITE